MKPCFFRSVWIVACVLLLSWPLMALDADHDGMDDIWQQVHGIASFTGSADPDGDSRPNLVECLNWSNPGNATDGYTGWGMISMTDVNENLLDDGWEAQHAHNGVLLQPYDDLDGDGRKNIEESIVGTNPWQYDRPWTAAENQQNTASSTLTTLEVGLVATVPGVRYRLQRSDDLVNWSFDPAPASTFWGDGSGQQLSVPLAGQPYHFCRFMLDMPDEDGDQLTAYVEMLLGTSDTNADSDSDGVPDLFEARSGLDPATNDSSADTDGDGKTNAQEYADNTHPADYFNGGTRNARRTGSDKSVTKTDYYNMTKQELIDWVSGLLETEPWSAYSSGKTSSVWQFSNGDETFKRSMLKYKITVRLTPQFTINWNETFTPLSGAPQVVNRTWNGNNQLETGEYFLTALSDGTAAISSPTIVDDGPRVLDMGIYSVPGQTLEQESSGTILPRDANGKCQTRIVLHKIKPLRAYGRYHFTLIPAQIRLWEDEAGTQAVDYGSSGTRFNANEETVVYADISPNYYGHDFTATLGLGWSGAPGLSATSVTLTVVPFAAITDHFRDGMMSLSNDKRPDALDNQGAYNTAGVFQARGPIVWANLSYDEERVRSSDNMPLADAIRFWHNGTTFEATDEDFVIRNGERHYRSQLAGYYPNPVALLQTACPDISPFYLHRVHHLPASHKVLLRVANAEQLRAFHLYKRIPDYDQGDGEETAIWGAFNSGAPWATGDHVLDATTIDITKWVNENAPNYVGYTETRSTETEKFRFGIEGLLYKGMKYDFSEGVAGKTFDGIVDFSVIIRNENGQEYEVDRFRQTLLRKAAFPGAQGFGKWARGGRTGEVYVVTSLDDNAAEPVLGSLRYGIEHREALDSTKFPDTERKLPRTIVFEVGGRIALNQTEKLNISRGNLTIAGQSAPGEGITLTDATFRVSGAEAAIGKEINRPNDTVLRYLRVRRATSVPPDKDPNSSADYPMGPDAFEVKSASRVIVDHCSFSGGIDGTMDIIQANQAENEQPDMDVTAQWSFVHHALVPHSKASLLRGKYGARYSVVNCFYGHNDTRNPEIGWLNTAVQNVDGKRLLLEFSNNVIYNWSNQHCGVTQGDAQGVNFEFQSIYYKPGLDTGGNIAFQIQSQDNSAFFLNNSMNGLPWTDGYEFVGNSTFLAKRTNPFITDFAVVASAATARDSIHIHGGCGRVRDIADLAYVNEIPPGTGNPQYMVTGEIPTGIQSAYTSASMPSGYADTDRDGMADAWEHIYNPLSGLLSWYDGDGDGWTNLEEYLNKTNPVMVNDPMAEVESNVDGALY